MEIASFVKNLADTHRYGIDCIIDTDNLLALALSNMPIECREPMDSCNDITNTSTVTTITCEGGTINITSDIVNTSHEITQTNLFGKGVIINNTELKVNKNFTASIKGVGITSKPRLLTTSGQTTVTDIDGNTYTFVTIDGYDWFTSNLKVTKFNDNIAITFHDTTNNDPYTVADFDNLWRWYQSELSLYSWYNDDINANKSRGGIYNRRAAMNPNICPTGWRVPTYTELNNMIINNNSVIRSTSNWTTPPTVPNPNGFNLIPNGYKVAPYVQNAEVTSKYNAKYYEQNDVASLWTTSFNPANTTQVIQLDNKDIVPIRPNINFPTAIPGNTSIVYTDVTRGAYGADNKTWTPFYSPTGNCIRCMRKK